MKTFIPILRVELKKAFCNWWMLACLLVGLALVAFHGFTYVREATRWLELAYMYADSMAADVSPYSCFCKNILTSYDEVASWLFFTLAPLLITLAYSWSYRSERNSGYVNSMLVRCERAKYYAAKYCATFIAAGTVVVLPLVVSYVATACILPAYMPDHYDWLYITMTFADFLGEFFWSNPALYMPVRIALDFVFAGLWATFVLALSMVVENRVALIAVPYIALFLLKTLGESLYLFGLPLVALSLFDQLRGHAQNSFNITWVLVAEMALLFVAGIAIPYALRKRDVL